MLWSQALTSEHRKVKTMNRIREQLADLERFVSEHIKPDHDIEPDELWDAAEVGHYELPGRLSQSGHAEVWLGPDSVLQTTLAPLLKRHDHAITIIDSALERMQYTTVEPGPDHYARLCRAEKTLKSARAYLVERA